MTTLARELQSRDHDVVIISLPDGESSVRAAGLTFLPCAAKEFPAGSLKERFRQRSKLKGEEALRAILQSAAGRTEAMLNSLPAVAHCRRGRCSGPRYRSVLHRVGADEPGDALRSCRQRVAL